MVKIDIEALRRASRDEQALAGAPLVQPSPKTA
jgi:hypothetical protein